MNIGRITSSAFPSKNNCLLTVNTCALFSNATIILLEEENSTFSILEHKISICVFICSISKSSSFDFPKKNIFIRGFILWSISF